MNNLDDRLRKMGVRSLFTERHAHIISGLIRWLQPQRVIEVGAFCGYVTTHIAQALHDNGDDGIVFAIDDFSLGTSAAVIHNVISELGLSNHLRIIDGDSSKVPWPQCDMVFIDGNHGYAGVFADTAKAIESGASCLVYHDSKSWWGVEKFISEFRKPFHPDDVSSLVDHLQKHFDIIECGFDEGLAILLAKPAAYPPKYEEKDYPEGYIK